MSKKAVSSTRSQIMLSAPVQQMQSDPGTQERGNGKEVQCSSQLSLQKSPHLKPAAKGATKYISNKKQAPSMDAQIAFFCR
mmetsp:Transcript_10221/g.28563  ORF Transcript_10221/g.28563 Transcript_10221/m.28563 type:complete len:81 (+) Transcript_10221:194-436(+)